MKKILIALLLSLIIISGCTKRVDNYNLTSVEVIEKMEAKESFLLYFTSKSCSACIEFTPVYEDVRKDYGEYMFALDIAEENAEHPEELTKLLVEYTGNVMVTPTTLVIVDGEVEQSFLGILKFSELENAIKNYKLVK